MVNKTKAFRWMKAIIIIYCAIGIALYYLQDFFLFHPEKLDSNYIFQLNERYVELKIPVNKQDTISLVKFLPENSVRKGIVLYYHGNMKNIEHYASYTGMFLKYGYEVWMGDYPGFGKTTGTRTEEKILQHARIIQAMAATNCGSDSIIIYGKSFGTGVATYVASYAHAKALVLETPYYSIPSLFAHYAFIYPVNYMSNYKIPTYEYLQDVKFPLIIFHGTGDDVIPYYNARRLITFLKKEDKFITIKGGGHNTLGNSQEYKVIMDSLLK